MQRLAGIHITQSFESMSVSMGKQWRGVKAGQGLICPKAVRYDKMRQNPTATRRLGGRRLAGNLDPR